MEFAAQRGGEVIILGGGKFAIPGGAQEMCEQSSWGHGFMAWLCYVDD